MEITAVTRAFLAAPIVTTDSITETWTAPDTANPVACLRAPRAVSALMTSTMNSANLVAPTAKNATKSSRFPAPARQTDESYAETVAPVP